MESERIDFINIFIHQIQSDTCSCIVELREAVNTCPDFSHAWIFLRIFKNMSSKAARAGQVAQRPFNEPEIAYCGKNLLVINNRLNRLDQGHLSPK